MEWLSKMFGRRTRPDPGGVPAPRAPFESFTDDPLLGGLQLFRPLVYVFEHQLLPQSLFRSHPELQGALQPAMTAGRSLQHISLLSVVRCETSGLWPPGAMDREDLWAYIEPLMDSVSCVPTHKDGMTVWTLRLPPPWAAGEAYSVALCKSGAEPWAYPDAPASCRYFTLEATFEPGAAAFCEWQRDGSHANHGIGPNMPAEAFTAVVFAHLAAAR